MLYKYVTENNLEDKQNYMYSEYAGEEFLESYFAIRNQYIKSTVPFLSRNNLIEYCKSCHGDNVIEEKLSMICTKLFEDAQNFNIFKKEINQITKTFEVHKRIYEQYDDFFRPVKTSGYSNYKNYLLCGIMLEEAYMISLNYKYLSCLLKMNDSIISIYKEMGNDEKKALHYILERERDAISNLCSIHNIF